MKSMVWNVYVESFNQKEIVPYNIFTHYGFNEDVKKIYKKHKNDFETFSEEVKTSLMYHFWSKCEWEIILSDWPPSSTSPIEKKVDVYDQVMLNWDIFIQYVWTQAHARKSRKK